MDDGADVVLIDAEPERIGSHHDLGLAGHEPFLILMPQAKVDLRVVGKRTNLILLQILGYLVHPLDGRAVNDAGLRIPGEVFVQHLHFRFLRADAPHLKIQIGTVKTGDLYQWFAETKLELDVLPHLWCCSRSKRHGWRSSKAFECVLDLQEVGAEVVAPLADAVRFIHGHQAERSLSNGLSENGTPEAFGRDVHEPELAKAHPINSAALLGL